MTTFLYLWLTVPSTWGQDAVFFYNRGLESPLACKKIEYFTRAIQLNPNLAEAYENRAIHYYFQWQLDKAIQDYTRVISLKPHCVNAYLMRGLAFFKKEYGEGIRAEIKNMAFHLSQKAVPEFSESLERAIDDFSSAIALDPELASAYSYRAKAYRIKGMTEAAFRDADRVIELWRDRQSIARAYATQARIYGKQGQDALSEAHLRKSITLDPYSPDYPPLHVPLISHDSSDTANLESVRWLGLLVIILIIVAAAFKLTLSPPKKRD